MTVDGAVVAETRPTSSDRRENISANLARRSVRPGLEDVEQLPARARVSTRLKVKVAAAVSTTNRSVSEVAADHGIAWWTVHRILVKAAPTSWARPHRQR